MKSSSNKEFLPIHSTQKEFMVTMRQKIETYGEHCYELKASRRARQCREIGPRDSKISGNFTFVLCTVSDMIETQT